MMRSLIISIVAISAVALIGGGTLLAITVRDDALGIAVAVAMLVVVIFMLDWLARHFRDIGFLEGCNEADRLYDARRKENA